MQVTESSRSCTAVSCVPCWLSFAAFRIGAESKVASAPIPISGPLRSRCRSSRADIPQPVPVKCITYIIRYFQRKLYGGLTRTSLAMWRFPAADLSIGDRFRQMSSGFHLPSPTVVPKPTCWEITPDGLTHVRSVNMFWNHAHRHSGRPCSDEVSIVRWTGKFVKRAGLASCRTAATETVPGNRLSGTPSTAAKSEAWGELIAERHHAPPKL
jgi:hypothetical protein